MSAFFVSTPTGLKREDAEVGLPDRAINLVGMYSIHDGEIEHIRRICQLAFREPDKFDPYDVHRPDLSLRARGRR